jgi:glycyl-tRNA synthetase
MANLLDEITALAKRRGFVFPGSEIYGGLANTYDYGPLGAEMLRNLRDWWWERFVTKRAEIFGLETSIIMSPRVWEASGHTESFTDALIDCKNCHNRTRADHLIEENLKDVKAEGKTLGELDTLIQKHRLKCPTCGKFNWTKAREFNLLFETSIGIVPEKQSKAYLRGETAQGMFVDFKKVVNSMRPTLPFGIAQSGKAFRNEITKGKFTFRTLEFDLAEFEYFILEKDWKKWFEYWKQETEKWALDLGVDKKKLRWRAHTKDELSHYSKRTEDLEYKYPFGFQEWFAVAYRTDYDLKNHMQQSGVDLYYTDPDTGKKFIPHVIEPTFGLSRSIVTLLIDGFHQEKDRIFLKLNPRLAPIKVAVFPLLRNKPKVVKKARSVFELIAPHFASAWDDRGNIGKRYYSQDEIGTPWCVTIDFQTLDDDTVTVRDRDSTNQVRVSIASLIKYLYEKLKS